MARTEGSINKNKRGLKAQLKQQYGKEFDVIMMMSANAKRLYDLIPEQITEDDIPLISETNGLLEKIAPYIESKLAATAVHLSTDDDITHEEWLMTLGKGIEPDSESETEST